MKYKFLIFVLMAKLLSPTIAGADTLSYQNCYGAENCQYKQVYNSDEKTYYTISDDGKTMTIYGPREKGVTATIPNDAFFGNESGAITTFPGGVTKLVVTGNITSIGDQAFRSAGLKSVVLPDSVTSFGNSSFFNMPALEEITLPRHLQSIGPNALTFSSKIKSLVIPDSLTEFAHPSIYGFIQVETLTGSADSLNNYLTHGGGFKKDQRILIDCTSGDCAEVLSAYDLAHNTSLASQVDLMYRVNHPDGSTTIYKNNDIVGYKGKRIYTIDEANRVAGKVNRVSIRYR